VLIVERLYHSSYESYLDLANLFGSLRMQTDTRQEPCALTELLCNSVSIPRKRIANQVTISRT